MALVTFLEIFFWYSKSNKFGEIKMKKILILSLALLASKFIFAETKNYDVIYNPDTAKIEIHLINNDSTKTLLESFLFQSGQWDYQKTVVDYQTGTIYMKEGGSDTWVSYNTVTDTLNLDGFTPPANPSPGAYRSIYQNIFSLNDIVQTASDSEGNPITKIGSTSLVGSDGEILISKNSDGSIHIGENSLVTIEENGVQQLYATDATGNKININIKSGTDLLIDGVSVSGSLSTNATNIATNTTDIATNKTSIATNRTSIAMNTTSIGAISADLNSFKTTTNNHMQALEREMNSNSAGIASAIAMSQFNLAQEGFSVGMGRGSFKSENKTAFGVGYGGKFSNGSLFQVQASKSGDASGVGITIAF